MKPETERTTGAASADDPYLPESGNGGFVVTRYELDLSYRMSSNRLSGKANLSAVSLQPLTRFSLDLVGLQVTKVSVNGRRAKKFSTRDEKLFIWLDKELPIRSAMSVEIRYEGNPGPRFGPWGDLGWEELTDGVLVAGQPNGAATWFPCNDHPANKASYRITVSTDSPYAVVSNGILTERTVKASQTRWIYDQPDPMATYLATLQVGQYVRMPLVSAPVEQSAVLPGTLWTAAAHDLGRQPEMMQTFIRLFGPVPAPVLHGGGDR